MRIGITGGIGSGKSYVSQLLTTHFGIPVYDSDREAKRLMSSSPQLRQQLVQLIGDDAYQPDGTLNKHVIARYLFAGSDSAQQVNAIVHPAVKADFRQWAASREREGSEVVAVESALLLEAGMADAVDRIVLVDAPLELRIQRAMKRDTTSRQQLQRRISQQKSEQQYRQAADYIIINDGRDLLPQLETILQTNNNKP